MPGICDHPKCGTHLDRGLYYKCEEHLIFSEDDVEEQMPISALGCDLFFCDRHQGTEFEKHWDWEPKPDVPKWITHVLNHDSWKEWREQNPATTVSMIRQLTEQEES